MASIVNIQAKGLVTHPNNLALPEGSLIEANNIIIERNDVIEPRRGFKLFGTPAGTITDRIKQLAEYRGKLLRHYSNKLEYQNGINNQKEVKFSEFSEEILEVEPGLRIKFIELNGNLYFTTSEGIKKLSVSSSGDFNGITIKNSGGIKALDGEAELNITLGNQTSFLPQDSTVAYRIVWGEIDNNNNLILGTPSQRIIIYNSLLILLIRDYLNFLSKLDKINKPYSLINDGNYVDELKIPITSTSLEIYNVLKNLVEKLDKDIVYADNDGFLNSLIPFEIDTVTIASGSCTISFINTNPGANVAQYFSVGSKIYLQGTFTPAIGSLNGIQTITNIDPINNSISFSTTATGPVSIDSSSKIESGKFRNLPVPLEPDLPTPNQQLVQIQEYLDKIIQGIQTLVSEIEIANVIGTHPLVINPTACSVSSGIATITFSTGDPRKYIAPGWYINILGMTLPSSSISNPVQVLSVTPTTITFNTTSIDGSIVVDPDSVIKKIIHFSDELATNNIDILDITTTTSVKLKITVPKNLTSRHFFQIYRSNIAKATGTTVLSDLVPDDEMQLVYENFPTKNEIEKKVIEVEDITPEEFKGANLYTNPSSGEGIIQANDIPPFAKDINKYKNTIFYANTQTRHRKNLSLLGVSNIIEEINNNNNPKIIIANEDRYHEYKFVLGKKLKYNFTCDAVSSISPSGYFLTNSAYDEKEFYIWFNTTGSDIDPNLPNKIGIMVDVSSATTAIDVAKSLQNTLALYPQYFSVARTNSIVTIENISDGPAKNPQIVTGLSGLFSINITQFGDGELAKQEISRLDCGPGSTLTNTGISDYFNINDTFNKKLYTFYYLVDNVTTSPNITGRFNISIPVLSTDSASIIAQKTKTIIEEYFDVEINTNILIIKNKQFGDCDSISIGTLPSSFSVSTLEKGALQIKVSNAISPSIALDETTKSLIRIVNKNLSESVNGYYLSSIFDVPGKFLLENNFIADKKFYILASSKKIGDSFNPILSPQFNNSGNEITITSISGSGPIIINTSTPHGLQNLDKIIILNSNSIANIDGIQTVTVISNTSFSINGFVQNSGNFGVFKLLNLTEASDNEIKPNRIYYSKFQQPESVPIVNYFDVGAENKPILRIFPLRDSLFVFKTDGLYRVSGEFAPFNVSLFDSSCILKAPDSLAVVNNVIFAYTSQGIITLSEAGVSIISQPIDSTIKLISSNEYKNFEKLTFGVNYESDDSYLLWTNKEKTDEYATICYRYSIKTKTWTTFDISATCGINFSEDDKLYLGDATTNRLRQERKNFSRYDYSDKEFDSELTFGNYYEHKIKLSDVSNFKVGDVVTQEQTLSVYTFNMLLKKLDLDTGVDNDYYITLKAEAGQNLRNNLVNLAQKLDSDPGTAFSNYFSSIANITGTITNISTGFGTVTITAPSHGLITGRKIKLFGTNSIPTINNSYIVTVIDNNTFTIEETVTTAGNTGTFITEVNSFEDLKSCYNKIIELLNLDTGVTFFNYQPIENNTLFESVIEKIDKNAKELYLNNKLDYIVGPLKIFESIKSSFTYAPITMGDPIGLKHLREFTMMYENKNFTNATLLFYTDLIPQKVYVPIKGMGNGIFGNDDFGTKLFGGLGNSTPTRTYIPRQHQRCRYIVVGFEHCVARESYKIYGSTITGRVGLSSKAYK